MAHYSFLIRYAWRNLWRVRGRTLLVLALIGPVFLSMLLMLANAAALEGQLDRLGAETATLIQLRGRATFGHINQAGGLNKLLPASLERELVELQYVTKVEPYLVAIEPIAGYYMTLHIGVRPGDAQRLATHGEVGGVEVVSGRNFTAADDGEDVALLGLAYAEKMGINRDNFLPGESVFVKDVLLDGEPGVVAVGTRSIGGRPFRIVGLFSSGYAFGDNQMFLPYRTFQRHYGAENQVSKYYLRVDKAENVAAVTQAIRGQFPELDIITRADGARFISAALGTMRRIGRIWLGATVLLAGAVLLFAMLLAADERVRELGTLKAIGASTPNLAVLLVGESVLLAGLGAMLGGLLYGVFGEAVGRGFFKATFGVYLPGHYGDSLLDNMLVSYTLSPTFVVVLVIATALAGGFGSLYALYKAHRLMPVEALRA